MACQSCDQLLGMMERELDGLTLVNSVTAFYRFAKVSHATVSGVLILACVNKPHDERFCPLRTATL